MSLLNTGTLAPQARVAMRCEQRWRRKCLCGCLHSTLPRPAQPGSSWAARTRWRDSVPTPGPPRTIGGLPFEKRCKVFVRQTGAIDWGWSERRKYVIQNNSLPPPPLSSPHPVPFGSLGRIVASAFELCDNRKRRRWIGGGSQLKFLGRGRSTRGGYGINIPPPPFNEQHPPLTPHSLV